MKLLVQKRGPLNDAPVNLKKADDELQIVWAEVYLPGVPDSEDDWMTAEDIRDMAYTFMKEAKLDMIDVSHDNQEDAYSMYVVESFIARDDDPLFVPGAWVAAVKVEDPEIWAMVKSGEINGFSMETMCIPVEKELEFEVPDQGVEGMTDEVKEHKHEFRAFWDANGTFLGGQTNVVDGHYHKILRGTLTEEANGHAHRFDVVSKINRVPS